VTEQVLATVGLPTVAVGAGRSANLSAYRRIRAEWEGAIVDMALIGGMISVHMEIRHGAAGWSEASVSSTGNDHILLKPRPVYMLVRVAYNQSAIILCTIHGTNALCSSALYN